MPSKLCGDTRLARPAFAGSGVVKKLVGNKKREKALRSVQVCVQVPSVDIITGSGPII